MEDRKGIILVLTLIIISILLATAVGFGVVIISNIKQAKSLDEMLMAYYGADSGIEQSLYQLRKMEISSISELTSNQNIGDGISWDIGESSDEQGVLMRQRLYNGQNIKFFFLGRKSKQETKIPRSVFLDIDWGDNVHGMNLQVNFTKLDPEQNDDGVLIFKTDKSQVFKSTDNKICLNFEDLDSDYAVEVKALGLRDEFIEKISIGAYNLQDCRSPLDDGISNIFLVSRGSHGNSFQRISAQLPPRDPISGLLSFVLFSEQDITKQ